MNKIFQSIICSGFTIPLLLVTGCKKDYQNPNGATASQVLGSAKGLMGTAIGIQRTYSLNVAPGTADANGFVTKEVILLNAGNTSELQLTTGGTPLMAPMHCWATFGQPQINAFMMPIMSSMAQLN